MSDTLLWLDAFPRDWDAAHERRVPGRAAEVVYYPGARRDGGSDGLWLRIAPAHGDSWTAVFSSELAPGRLSVVSSWPHPSTVFVAVGGDPYLVHSGLPDLWSRLGRPTARHLEPLPDLGLALVLDDDRLSGYDADGLAWESDRLGPHAQWLGRLDDEVHLRSHPQDGSHSHDGGHAPDGSHSHDGGNAPDGGLLHRVRLRHGRTVTEPAPW